MFAPLALKSVHFARVPFPCLIGPLHRIPVQTIQFNTPTPTPRKATVAKAIIGAVTALLLLVFGIVAFILWRRRTRRRNIRESLVTSYADTQLGSGMELTPFILTHLDGTHGDPEPWMEWQQHQSGQQSSSISAIGLSSKELARMRAENLLSQPATTHPTLDERPYQPLFPPVAATEQTATTSPPMFRTLQSQVDRLWREMRQLRAERPDSEAPPSYVERAVSHSGGAES